MSSCATPPSARSQALDDLIMETNSSSIVSKRSVESFYYPNEPHFFRYFVRKFQRRAPLINRGYWLRLRVIDVVVGQFLTRPTTSKKIVINLGCGSDVLPWQSHTRRGSACANALFVDIDYPDLMLKKRAVVLETPRLREILGSDFTVGKSGVLLRSQRYCQLGCDLRQLEELRTMLEELLPLPDCEVLFVAEVSITYMDTGSADSLIQWASTIGKAEFCLLEQLLPHGPAHPFAKTMLSHFDKLKTPPRSVLQYPTLNSQQNRFLGRGWHHVDICDLWDAWSSNQFIDSAERSALDQVEPFDEWEDLILFARHYFIAHARAYSVDGRCGPQRLDPEPIRQVPGLDIGVTCYGHGNLKRRFGDAMTVSDVLGRRFMLHIYGMGTNSRADSWDIYTLGAHGASLELPVAGPLSRMCHTITDLGDFGVLLAGGRNSPRNAFSDCWLLHKGVNPSWHPTWRLPTPLYRHSTIRLTGSSLALVVGGKTNASNISDDCFLFCPDRGWLRCLTRGSQRRATFGGIACNTPRRPDQELCVFHGIVAGGINKDGCISTEVYLWRLEVNENRPTIEFEAVRHPQQFGFPLSLFGAKCLDWGPYSLVCGGLGYDASCMGRGIVAASFHDNGSFKVLALRSERGVDSMPFMVGSAVITYKSGVVIVGGGATCFSMGTFWETGVYSVEIPPGPWANRSRYPALSSTLTVEHGGTRKIVGSSAEPPRTTSAKGIITKVPRIKLGPGMTFEDVLANSIPVIIDGLNLGGCVEKWNPQYMVEQIGGETEVAVHKCHRDSEKMDFNSKNFAYTSTSFGKAMAEMQAGSRMYLRSLSRSKPSEEPANLEHDFPELAQDFCLPPELRYVDSSLFSSVLRISGRVNMWLHYDVMANVYAQVGGDKRMILFPPSDVTQLSFAPGASSSSLDVFAALDTSSLEGTHPHEALLGPGDVLFLPALWPHTATPLSAMSIAVNVFFRDLESGYATGRDVYGNRDLAAYEKGRLDAARIARGFEQLPPMTRRFYLARIADELQQAAEGA